MKNNDKVFFHSLKGEGLEHEKELINIKRMSRFDMKWAIATKTFGIRVINDYEKTIRHDLFFKGDLLLCAGQVIIKDKKYCVLQIDSEHELFVLKKDDVILAETREEARMKFKALQRRHARRRGRKLPSFSVSLAAL